MLAIPLFVLVLSSCKQAPPEEAKAPAYRVFSFEQELRLPGAPEVIYDAITGDISAWWDHSFTEHPLS